MHYLKVKWIHKNNSEPVLLISELDDRRFEIRKIEIFSDESYGLASNSLEFGGTVLSPLPIPSDRDISSNPEFIIQHIDGKEFEELWAKLNNFLRHE